MLFPVSYLKSKSNPHSSTRDHARRLRIPTGPPRLVESSLVCQEQAPAIVWKKLIDAISQAAIARLALLKGRVGKEWTSCPWERFTGCSIDCRCRGERRVTVDFLRAHYARLAIEVALFARPASKQLTSKSREKGSSVLKNETFKQQINGTPRQNRKLLIQRKST